MVFLERTNEIIEYLQGSCKDIGDIATPEEAQDEKLLAAIDEEIFLCDDCGWWCEINEQAEDNDGICSDCNDSQS